MKNLSSALMWGGLALFLLPFALICGALIVALALQSPTVGFIALGVVGGLIGRVISRHRSKKGSPE